MLSRLFTQKTNDKDFVAACRERLRTDGYQVLFTESISEAYPPHFDDLWTLVEEVKVVRPSLALEYGAGWSTYVIAETLRRLGSGSLISIELDQHWGEVATARVEGLPAKITTARPELRPCLTERWEPANFWYGKKRRPQLVNIVTIAFPQLYTLKPDFIFIDGPGKSQVPSLSAPESEPIVSDPLFMDCSPTICVDGRAAQCAFLGEHLGGTYRPEIRRKQKFTVFRSV